MPGKIAHPLFDNGHCNRPGGERPIAYYGTTPDGAHVVRIWPPDSPVDLGKFDTTPWPSSSWTPYILGDYYSISEILSAREFSAAPVIKASSLPLCRHPARDPIFRHPGFGRTMAQLSVEEKNIVSHRGQSFRAFGRWLRLNISTERESSGHR